MKKLIVLLGIVFSLGIVSAKENSGTFSIACYKCKEATLNSKRGYSDCLGCPAYRRYDLEKGHEYMIYKCHHGHTLYVAYKGGERK